MTDYLQNVYFSRLIHSNGGSGFTNQIMSLTSSIVEALFSNKRAVAVDFFGVDYKEKDKKVNISDIIDLKKTNEYLSKKYNIILLDKNTMKFDLHKVYFGIMNNMFDITNNVSSYISKENNSLYIPKNTFFTNFQGDPCLGVIKTIFLYYSLDGYNFLDTINENLNNDIMSHVPTELCKYDFEISSFLMKMMPDIFNDILKNIKFTKSVIPTSLLENDLFKNYVKVNVLHLRLEDDALEYWGKQNIMTSKEFEIYIENKYIELIQKYIDKSQLNIILTYSPNNSVIKFLQNNGYPYLFVKKNTSKCEREIDAIFDLSLSTKCNNIFIGNFFMKAMQGSSFSYYILQKLEYSNVKKIAISLDNIREPEDVFY